MTTMDIRPAERGDIEALQALYRVLDDLHIEYLPDRFQKTALPFRDRAFFERLLGFEENLVLVAEIDGQPVAFVEAYKMEGLENGPKKALTWMHIENIAVLPEWEGRGIATALVEEVHHIARSSAMDRVELRVYDFNQGAMAFYEAMGYRPVFHRMEKILDQED